MALLIKQLWVFHYLLEFFSYTPKYIFGFQIQVTEYLSLMYEISKDKDN